MDILEQLRTPLTYTQIDGVTVAGHPCGPLGDVIEEAADEIESLRAQLPDGMEHCTIQFKECPEGHGHLTATNWVQHDCAQCEIQRLREALEGVAEAIFKPGTDPWEAVYQMRETAKTALGVNYK